MASCHLADAGAASGCIYIITTKAYEATGGQHDASRRKRGTHSHETRETHNNQHTRTTHAHTHSLTTTSTSRGKGGLQPERRPNGPPHPLLFLYRGYRLSDISNDKTRGVAETTWMAKWLKAVLDPLPEHWHKKKDEEGGVFYWNRVRCTIG